MKNKIKTKQKKKKCGQRRSGFKGAVSAKPVETGITTWWLRYVNESGSQYGVIYSMLSVRRYKCK